MMREDNPYRCSRYSLGFPQPSGYAGMSKGGIWKERIAVGIKAGSWDGSGVQWIQPRPFEKSDSYLPTDWLHLHRHCLFMWQMGPINFIAGPTVIKLTKLAGQGVSRHLAGSVAVNHDRQMGVIFHFLVANAQTHYFPCLGNSLTHLIISLNNITRLLRHNVFGSKLWCETFRPCRGGVAVCWLDIFSFL